VINREFIALFMLLALYCTPSKKKTQATAQSDVEIARSRYREVAKEAK
jgi:phage-related protein